MPNRKTNYRYVYVKANNVVRELSTIRSTGWHIPDGGPEAYVAHFIEITKGAPALIVSYQMINPLDETLSYGNIIARAYYWRPGPSIRSALSRINVSLKLFLLLIKFRPTHILCWDNQSPLWICYIVSKIYGSKFVPSRHTSLSTKEDSWYRQLNGIITKYVLRSSTAIVCHGPYLRDELLTLGISKNRIYEFNWGFKHLLTYAAETQDQPELTEIHKDVTVLFIGRIIEGKGVFDLLEACKPLFSKYKELRLTYAGDGRDLNRLRAAASRYHLQQRIDLLGRVTHHSLAPLIKKSKVVITPTRSSFPEGRCMAAIEGLIMGIPVIAPNYGPFPYLVNHMRNGLLFDVNSTQSLEETIDLIIRDHELYHKLKVGAKEFSKILASPKTQFPNAVLSAFS
jgi:glycosyltransferase involved in cell wall biosynthesis